MNGNDGEGPTRALRVLVVDDDADVVESTAILLGLSGYEVVTARDGAAALEAAATRRPDVVLLDVELPGMDGYEVARRLRRLPDLKDVRLIAVTGYCWEVDVRLAHEAGFDHHLIKPVDYDVLVKHVDPAGITARA